MGWLATLFAALLALWDGSHTVRIESREQGFAVILGHDLWHRLDRPHDWVTRALTCLSVSDNSPSGDHEIRVGTPSLGAQLSLERPREASWAASPGGVGLASALGWPPGVALRDVPGPRASSSVPVERAALQVARIHVRRC